jgi:hypothetical protein
MHLKSGKQRRKQVIAQKETNGHEHKKNKRESKIPIDLLPQRSAATFI